MHEVLKIKSYICLYFREPCSVSDTVMFVAHVYSHQAYVLPFPFSNDQRLLYPAWHCPYPPPLLEAAAWLIIPHDICFPCPPFYFSLVAFLLMQHLFSTYNSSLASFLKLIFSFFPSYRRNNSPSFVFASSFSFSHRDYTSYGYPEVSVYGY